VSSHLQKWGHVPPCHMESAPLGGTASGEDEVGGAKGRKSPSGVQGRSPCKELGD